VIKKSEGCFDMRAARTERLKWGFFLSAVVVVFAGSLLHFAWEWSGRSTFVAVFAATNESTWEHLKLAFWPALALAPIQRLTYGSLPGWLPAVAIRCVLPSFVIVALFYGYTAVVGAHHLAADIAIFVFAVFLGELLGHAVLRHEFGFASQIGAFGILLLATLLFSTLTFRPPDCFLFHEPPSSRSEEALPVGIERPSDCAGGCAFGLDNGSGWTGSNPAARWSRRAMPRVDSAPPRPGGLKNKRSSANPVDSGSPLPLNCPVLCSSTFA
jgi:hypothetical protein